RRYRKLGLLGGLGASPNCVMADVPEGYYSDPYGAEDLEPGIPELSESLKLAEDAQPELVPETAEPELHAETDQEPQPEMEGEDFNEGALESARNVYPILQPTEMSEEIPEESEAETEPLEAWLERFVEMDEEHLEDLGVSVDENHEPDLELPKETKSEVPGATISETRFELQENILKESPTEQYEERELQSTDLTKPEFPSEKPRNSIKEADTQPPKTTQRKSFEKKRTEPTEQVTPAETQRKSADDTGTEPYEEIKPAFPDQKPSKSSEEIQRKSTDEKVPETPEEIKAEFLEENSGESNEEGGVELSEKTKPVQEETERKSSAEKVLEPPEDSKPAAHQKDKQRKSTEKTGVPQPQKSTSRETLRMSESTEQSQLPPQENESEVQEKTQTEPTKEKDAELTDKDKGLPREDTYVQFVKYEAESTQNSHSAGVVVEYDYYQTRNLHGRVRKDIQSGSLTTSEGDSISTDYSLYKRFQNVYEPADSSNYDVSLAYQNVLQEAISENESMDLCPKLEELVPKGKKRQSKSSAAQQFDFLAWSPEKVAEWISKLGFPQYKVYKDNIFYAHGLSSFYLLFLYHGLNLPLHLKEYRKVLDCGRGNLDLNFGLSTDVYECFTTNFISGRKLIHVNCSNLPQMGITDFEDMKVISRHTRELLGIEEPLFSRSISLPYRDNIGLFLEQKGHSGVKSDSLTLPEFVEAAGLQDYAPQ
ncbi:Sterile alpha motif domain-containing protein 15, partial [Galemys pyrenaicus]